MQLAHSHRTAILHWCTGLFGSWALVWLLGPWIVNSTLVRDYATDLGVVRLREGDTIHWRREGWADTVIGPHGLPGWKPSSASRRVAIYGDSQVEGFCVPDHQKISNQLIQIVNQNEADQIDCLPIARSGSDARDWAQLVPKVEELWHPRLHVFIVTELSDLIALAEEAEPRPNDSWQAPSPSWIRFLKQLRGDALFQAGRNLLIDQATGNRRRLRFSLGPSLDTNSFVNLANETKPSEFQRTAVRLAQIGQQAQGRFLLVYAPSVPRLGDKVDFSHPADADWDQLQTYIASQSIDVIDLRANFVELWTQQFRFGRGFHNGQPASGHLNEHGNRVIAQAIRAFLASPSVQMDAPKE